MHTDADFLAAVAAEPASALTRLVYADWLDEQNDPRAELIRFEEEMRTWAVFSDAHWQAKPRRTELRRQFDAEWVRALGYGVAVPPLFRYGLPEDVRLRWRLIREAYECCSGQALPDVGGGSELAAQAERNLQDKLPESVAHFVAFVTDLGDQPPDSPFAQLTTFAAQHDLEFLWLLPIADHGTFLCVRRADWRQPDPPVVVASVVDGSDEDGWVFEYVDDPAAPVQTLSEWVLETILERLHGTGGVWGDRVSPSVARPRLVERFGPPVRVERSDGHAEELFEAVDVLLRLDDRGDGTGLLRASVRPGGVEWVRGLLDFPPTPDGYRGGALLPAALVDIGERGRMSNPWIADAADDQARAAFDGGGANAELPSAERWARLAAEYGDAGSARFLYLSHLKGRFRLSEEEEFRYLLQAAETSEPLFACLVAGHYRDGKVVPKDLEAAARWFRRAAEGDYPAAWYCLGMLHVDGIGVPQDRGEAIRCLEKAAALGDPDAHGALVALRAGRVKDTTPDGATSRVFAPPGRNVERADKPDKMNRSRKK